MLFKPAVRTQAKLRMTIDGPAGSGKTYTALRFAHAIAQGGRIAVIDTERGSASKYVGEAPDGYPWMFDTAQLPDFAPERYVETIQAAGRAGYSVLVIDSLSHAWEGTGGALDMKDRAAANMSSRNDYTAWRVVTPHHNKLVDTILMSPLHIISTMRSRMEYVQEKDEKTGRTTIRKVGLSPIQRPGMEYEFDVVADMDWAHVMTVSKSRCSAIADAKVEKPGVMFAQALLDWLTTGEVDVTNLIPQVQQAPAAQLSVAPQRVSISDLVDKYGVDAVLEANNGALPATEDDMQMIAAVLEALK